MKNKFTFIILMLLTILYSCSEENSVYSTELKFPEFNSITVKKAQNVVVEYGKKHSVVVEGNEKAIKDIVSEVVSNTLIIDINSDNSQSLKYTITLPEIREVINESLSDISIGNFEQEGSLTLKAKNEGNIEVNQFENVSLLNIYISGSGSIIGNATFDHLQDLNIENAGSGNYRSYAIQAKNAIATINGSGSCYLYSLNKLNVFINSSGSVYYKGNPEINKFIKGTGSLINAN